MICMEWRTIIKSSIWRRWYAVVTGAIVAAAAAVIIINKCFTYTRLYIQQSWWGHVCL